MIQKKTLVTNIPCYLTLEGAIAAHRRVVEPTLDGHSDKSSTFNNLDTSYLTCFQHAGELDDLEAAIVHALTAADLTSDGHPNKAAFLTNLGNALQSRYERLGELDKLPVV